MTDHEPRSDGLQLLRAMNETQARGSEEVPVTPALAAHDAGLEIGPERYAAAMHFLRNEGALVVHPFGEQSVGDYERGGGPYYITQRGFMMLEEAKGAQILHPDRTGAMRVSANQGSEKPHTCTQSSEQSTSA